MKNKLKYLNFGAHDRKPKLPKFEMFMAPHCSQSCPTVSLRSGEHELKLTSTDGSSLWLKSLAQFFCILMKRNETRGPSSTWQGRDTARHRLIMWLLHDTWGGRMRPCEYFVGWQQRVVMMELSTPSIVYPLELSMKFRESFHKFLQCLLALSPLRNYGESTWCLKLEHLSTLTAALSWLLPTKFLQALVKRKKKENAKFRWQL